MCVHMLIVWLWTWVVVVVRVAVSSCVAVLVAGLSGDCRTDGGGSHRAVHSRKFGSTSLVGTGPRGWVAVASFGAGGEGRGPHSGPVEKVEARVALSPQFLFQAESLAECLFGLVRHRHGVVHSVGDCSGGVVLVRRREFGCVAAALPSAFVRACAGDCSLGGLAPPLQAVAVCSPSGWFWLADGATVHGAVETPSSCLAAPSGVMTVVASPGFAVCTDFPHCLGGAGPEPLFSVGHCLAQRGAGSPCPSLCGFVRGPLRAEPC